MGEKIKDIGEFTIGDKKVLIELNEGYSKEYSKYDIHIQSDHMQYCMTNKNFIRLATTLINAREMLDAMKTWEE